MRDAASMTGQVQTARLLRAFDEPEAKRRNALSQTKAGLKLAEGELVTVVETFGNGEAFLVEFTRGGKIKKDACDWMGVLTPAEIEVVTTRNEKI